MRLNRSRGVRPAPPSAEERRAVADPGVAVRRLLAAGTDSARAAAQRGDRGFRGGIVLDLQRLAGNGAVQRLLGATSGPGLPVQRYPVGAARTAGCAQVVAWLNRSNPHRPSWARTRANFTWSGTVEVTGQPGSLQAVVRDPRVSSTVSVDMPQWSPGNRDMAAAWQDMYRTLRAHEADHERIAAEWKVTLLERLTALRLDVSSRNRRSAQDEVQREWQGWLGEHQQAQNAIDPFVVLLDCP